MSKQWITSSLLALGLVAALGCKDKGPVPSGQSPSSAAPKVGTTETTGAHPGAANPHGGMAAATDASGRLDVGAIAFAVPEGWETQTPSSSMRRAQLVANGSAGPAELIVYYFGPQGAGSDKDNIDRWVGQFAKADGSPADSPDIRSLEVSGHSITRVEVAGTYTNTMGQPGATPEGAAGRRMLAAIAASAEGPYYFKMVGPDATVAEQRDSFDGLLRSIVAAP